MQKQIVPDIVQPTDVAAVTKDDTIFKAAEIMRGKRIAAVIVVDDAGHLTGIVTERDIVFRAVAGGLNVATAKVSEIMTANPDTLAPTDSAFDALELMQTRNYRHLPVVSDRKCIAVVSIRDLFASVKTTLEENIRETEAFVFGDRYGA
ncbi:MAG: CBS domain-containing protein [Proteobacteria bacterium]|nr:CBS domain-containing protein [Pseudomonadota bacterium]